MTGKVLVFAGTSDGKKAASELVAMGASVTVSMATEYGMSSMEIPSAEVVHGGFGGAAGISKFLKERGFDAVLDATHPYARKITASVTEACASSGVPLVRLLRGKGGWEGMTVVPDAKAAAEYLNKTSGNVLLTTGSKELGEFTSVKNYGKRLFARVLPLPDVVAKCSELGFSGKNLICMQGPYSEELNAAMLEHVEAKYMVTKDSGNEGGFDEKISAALGLGVETVLIARPPEAKGVPYDTAMKDISKILGLSVSSKKRVVHVIGIGMGGRGMTLSAVEACKESDVLIGARRMVESVPVSGKPVHEQYKADKVIDFLKKNPQYGTAAVLFSGDIGFHSGAKKLLESLPKDWIAKKHCGVASPIYLCGILETPWEDVRMLSAHGKECNVSGEIARNGKTFMLLDGHAGLVNLCADLKRNNLGHVVLHAGIDLGGASEKVVSGTAKKMPPTEGGKLYCALIVNPEPKPHVSSVSIPDECFERGGAPMTKAEVRSVSVSKLNLFPDSIVYDVGAGTGSVTIEMASAAYSGKIYAFEKNPESAGLIRKNAERFSLSNIEVVEGLAPESFKGLPAPTHAFIGGSSGNMKAIISRLRRMNPQIRIVVNAITLETVAETVDYLKSKGMTHDIAHLSVAKSKPVGGYSMMVCNNPVYVISFGGSEVLEK